MIFKEIDNIRDVGVICHYFAIEKPYFTRFLDCAVA